MKITGLKTFVANASRTNFVFVKLYTDEGIDGVGEATLEWKTLTVVAALEELERVADRAPTPSRWMPPSSACTATATGAPVRSSAPRSARSRRRCSTSRARRWACRSSSSSAASTATASHATPTTGSSAPTTPDEYAAKARAAVAMGYRALKWDPFDTPTSRWTRPSAARTIAIVEAVRAAVGPDVELMLDVHGRLNVPTAIAMCRALARLRSHLDRGADPAREHRRAGRGPRREPGRHRRRRALVRARPLAGGAGASGPSTSSSPTSRQRRPRRDQAHRPHGARPPDPGRPAQPGRPGDERDDAAHRGGDPQLQDLRDRLDRRALAQELVRETLRFEAGAILAPTAPGLGVELIEEACARFPYTPYNVPIFDGTMNTSGVATGAETLTGKG